MSDEPGRRPRTWFWWVILALLILYAPSMGPVGWISNRNESWTIFDAVYAPLIWLCESSEPIAGGINWYLDFWR
jgi:uncharacterized membrane protein YhaH (DUF805 family)